MPAFFVDPFVFLLVVFILRTQKANADILQVRKLCRYILRVDLIGYFLFNNFYYIHRLKFLSRLVPRLAQCKPYLKIGL